MVLVYYGFNLSRDIYQQTSPGLEISMSIPYSAIPVGALLMLVHVLLMPFKDENKDGNRSC
jgi:TRAP-type C4-dicarboxylate transport system permease small subunit